jgi:lipoyl(octanoyl) transferase
MVVINAIQLGRVPYGLGLKVQAELVAARKAGQIGDTLVLLEHEPVITLGRNARAEHIVAGREQLAARGVEVYECDRGGDVTFHGPGQLVGYPIFDLFGYSPRIGAVEFVRKIEEAIIRTCAGFGIEAERVPGLTGVWISPRSRGDAEKFKIQNARFKIEETNRIEAKSEIRLAGDGQRWMADDRRLTTDDSGLNSERKIAAIGVHISRGVTSHGFALNVTTDLEYFKLIVPCGISDRPVTSMELELGSAPEMTSVAEAVARGFGQVFNSQILWVRNLDELLGRKVGVPRQAGELEAVERVRNA